MPNTPKIVTRQETTSSNTTDNLNKGSKLTFAEMDSNFIELKNGSIGVVGDDSTGIDIAHGSTLKVAGTGGISTSVSGDTLTVDASSIVTSSLGDLTAVGSTLIAPSNADLTLSASGTGAIVTADTVELTQNTNLTPNLVVSGYSSTFLKLGNDPNRSNRGNTIHAEGSPLYLNASGSNTVHSENDFSVGTGNISAPNDVNMTLSVSGTGQITVDGATIGSNSIELDQLTISGNSIRTNVTNANLEFDTNGTGNIQLGDITVDAHLSNKTGFTAINVPLSADGSTSQDVNLNMTSSGNPELYFNNAGSAVDDRAKIRVGTGGLNIQTDGANSSNGHIRIQAAGDITLAPSGVLNLGSDTIVVSGNRMYTDASNEDMELLANGTGNISMLSQANMNSNKIVNVTDPTANQDAATKAYVDAQVLASGDTGDLTIDGSTITAPSNADLTLTVAGTGQIVVDGTLTATEVISDLTGTIEFDAKATEAITKGEAVYIAGIDGNTPTIALARANAAGTMPAFGIAAADIALNATGKITTFGSLTGLDAADFGETSITFALGDTIYISSAEAGKLTNVAPTGEANFIQNIGKIERATPTTNITIKVGGAGRSNATPALNDGNIFIGNASNQSSTVALADQIKNYKAITLTGDDSTGTDVNIGETFKIAGTQNITTAVSGDTLTVTGPDLTSYLTAETNDLTSAVTWANVPDANITQSSVTQHQAALSITESQISDLGAYITDANITIVGDDSTGVTFSAKNNDDITITGTGGITSTVSGNTITIDGSGVSGGGSTGDLTITGSTISAPSNASLTLQPGGTGNVVIDGLTYPGTDGTNGQVLTTDGAGNLTFTTVSGGAASTGDFTFTGNNMSTSSSNADMELGTSGTGAIVLKANGGDISNLNFTSGNRNDNANILYYEDLNHTAGSKRLYSNTAQLRLKLDGTDSGSSNARFRAFQSGVDMDINGTALTNTGSSRGPNGVTGGMDITNTSADTGSFGALSAMSGYNYFYDYSGTAGNIDITNAYGFRLYSPTEYDGIDGSVTNAYGCHIGGPVAYSYNNTNLTVTNSYGYYYNHNPDNTTFTNDPYAFYTNDDSVRSNPGALNKFNEYSYNATHSADGTYTIDWANGNLQTVTLGANITGFTMSNFPTSTKQSVGVTLYLVQDGTGSRSMTFSAAGGETFKFANGATTSSVSSANDIQTVYIFSRYTGTANIYYWTLGPTYS